MEDRSQKLIEFQDDTGYFTYLAGFHCFVEKAKALVYADPHEVVHRVLVKDITATGLQGNCKSFAARKIYIMERVERSIK